jgi:translation initiation factor IF-3
MPTFKAIKIAEEAGLDLVEVSPNGSNPVICKLMDYGRHRYENQKKQHKTFGGQKKMKEIKMGIKIEKHDLEIKTNHGIQFLEDGHSVRVIIQLRGRDMQRKDEAFKIMAKISESFEVASKLQEQPVMLGNTLSSVFTADKKK